MFMYHMIGRALGKKHNRSKMGLKYLYFDSHSISINGNVEIGLIRNIKFAEVKVRI